MTAPHILVTGGTGYIGAHTVVELQEAGYRVTIVDSLIRSRAEIVDRIGWITGVRPGFSAFDLCDQKAVAQFFRENPDLAGVIHFAALKSVGESVEQPLAYYQNNLDSMIHVLSAMRAINCPAMVFSSSCTVYGEPDAIPVTEDSPIKKAESPYGNTKHIGEDLLHDSCHAYGLQGLSLRYFNPIGAHDSALIGEWPTGKPENLLPFITQTAMGARSNVTVFGNDYPTRDGTCIRDYIHVVDVAKAHVTALERLLHHKQQTSYEYFNIGTGEGYSVLEAIRAFEDATGIQVPYELGERRPGDVTQVYADTTKANQELGWYAERSLSNMMATAWEWEKAGHQASATAPSSVQSPEN